MDDKESEARVDMAKVGKTGDKGELGIEGAGKEYMKKKGQRKSRKETGRWERTGKDEKGEGKTGRGERIGEEEKGGGRERRKEGATKKWLLWVVRILRQIIICLRMYHKVG